MGLLIYRSRSTDIYSNLALEDHLFRHLNSGDRVFFLWRNRDAVVVGRNQNPYLECDVPAMRHAGISLARRRTGGGAVWHDLGNLCFTFMGKSVGFDRRANIETIIAALRLLSTPAEANARLDILVGGYKVSGSAFRESGGNSLHHGTILLSSDLTRLACFLSGNTGITGAKGVQSIRSKVTNLSNWVEGLGMENLFDTLTETVMIREGGSVSVDIDPESNEMRSLIEPCRAELRDHSWIYGATPPFLFPYATDRGMWTLRIEGGKVADLIGNREKPPELLSKVVLGVEFDRLGDVAAALPRELQPQCFYHIPQVKTRNGATAHLHH